MNNCDRRMDFRGESDRIDMCKPIIPEKQLDMNDVPYLGSFQQLLFANMGRVVTIEFIFGLNETKIQTGIIESVNARYVMLKNICNNSRYVGDMFNIRGFTFPCDC